jgi:uncharacterized protein (TIRG00374 family)
MRAGSRSRLRLGLLLAGVGLLGVLIARLGPAEIAAELRGVGPGILWLLGAYSAGTALAAVPWYLLLPPTSRPGLGGAVASRFAASAANAVLPLMGVGGEPCRLLWLRPEARSQGVAAIIVDRVLFAAASALFLLLGFVAVFEVASLPGTFVVTGAVVAGSALLGAASVAWVAARHRVVGRLQRLARRLRRKPALATTEIGLGDHVDDALSEMLGDRRGRLVACLVMHFGARILLGAEVYVALLVLDVPVSLSTALVLAAVPVVLAFAGAWVPSQIGLQEGAQALVCSALGLSPAVGVTLVLLQRIRQVMSVSVGWILVTTARHRERGATRPS